MKRLVAILMLLLLVVATTGVLAGPSDQPRGPAPNSGDGVSDGSGLDNGPYGPGEGSGPAPNSGDGIPDGSGFDGEPPYQGNPPSQPSSDDSGD